MKKIRYNTTPNAKDTTFKMVDNSQFRHHCRSIERWSNNPTKLNEKKMRESFEKLTINN